MPVLICKSMVKLKENLFSSYHIIIYPQSFFRQFHYLNKYRFGKSKCRTIMFNQFIVPEIPTDIRRIPWIGRVLRYDMLLYLELDNKDLYTLEKYNIILVYLIKLYQRVDQLDLLTKITQIVLNEGGNHVTIPVHDDAIKWKHFSPHKSHWRGALMFPLICAWINDWVYNREAGDLRRLRAHYDVTVRKG